MSHAFGRKSIFITGAASGIGAATAKHFSARGWFCGLFDVNAAGVAETARALGPHNSIDGVLDVRDREDWRRAMSAFTEATNGKMNVLFNNAGVGRHGWFEDVSTKDNDWIVDVNLKGVIHGVETALPLLKATPGARVVNTASASGLVGSPQLAVYSATKFAVRGLTEALDAEFRDHDIRVSSLMPWFVQTPILDMGSADGSNIKLSDRIRANHMSVYPVEMAAEQAWNAAHGKAVHYTVGKEADQLRSMARWMPEALRKRLRESVPPRH